MSSNLHLLQVRPSPIHGLGAFALTNIPRGTLIGPYKGKYLTAAQRKNVVNGAYMWKIHQNLYVDAMNFVTNNPLRYVNGSKTKAQQALVNCEMRVLQDAKGKKRIFYIITKDVPKDKEIIISYGNNYFV